VRIIKKTIQIQEVNHLKLIKKNLESREKVIGNSSGILDDGIIGLNN